VQTNTLLHFVTFLPLIDVLKEVMVTKIDYCNNLASLS